MKNIYLLPVLLAVFLFVCHDSLTQVISYQDSWGNQGLTLEEETNSKVVINYSLENFYIDDIDINGNQMKTIKVPEIFLPNDEGAPDLPGTGQYIAIPQYSQASIKIIASRTETISDIEIAPAPRIPLDTEDGPMYYEKNMKIYSKDEYYPKEPVIISEKTNLRGVDVVMLGITPFQYNPVSKELIIYRDIRIEITYSEGNGHFGEDRLRSRWWDPIIKDAVLNPDAIPEIDYSKKQSGSKTPDYEYIIITPDDPTFLSWADSIKTFRTLQGIKTGVVTTTEIGGNTTTAIEAYVNNAYNNWDVPPVAVLLLGDYGTSGNTVMSSADITHPYSGTYITDNVFADVDGDDLPEMAFARMTAQNSTHLENMITKFLDYERQPPANSNFYDNPITALGWQDDRWFQICSETIGGFFNNELGKSCVRINALGTPANNYNSGPWSTATNTTTVLNYFGPSGLGYIPGTPQELGGFTGGDATDVNNAINSGAFILQHRDHGGNTGWGEPYYLSSHLSGLGNNDPVFVMSINCLTGRFDYGSEVFAEAFHRMEYGALGLIAASQVSYSFVNDAYVWGLYDYMWPDFDPGYGSAGDINILPCFANVSAKYYLQASSWPSNPSSKTITYRLFHHHGDAFSTVYSEIPQNLTVVHDPVLIAGATTFSVTANAGSLIALTVNGEIIGTADGTGSAVAITIPAQSPGNVMVVTVTKQNYYRYSANVNIVADGIYAQFSADDTNPCTGSSVTFTDLSFGTITSWSWSFPGGTPNSFNGQNPPPITYGIAGTYDVSLTISDGTDNDTETKIAYITATDLVADFAGIPTSLIAGNTVTFTDLTSCNADSYSWSFPGGSPSSYSGQNPPAIQYDNIGLYDVSLTVSNALGSDTKTYYDYIEVIDCYTVSLPWIEDFETVGPTTTFTANEPNINGSCKWAYEKTANGRLQFTAYAHGGSQGAAVDANPSGTYSVNYLTATMDMSAYASVTNLELSFWHMNVGEEDHSNDRVWIRGSDTDTWIEVYDLYDDDANTGWVEVTGIDIDAFISGAGQSISSTFQLRFGQEDNYPFASDGRVFDDISITGDLPISYIWNGNTSTDWDTPSNWSGNTVPVAGANVFIPSTVTSGNWPVFNGNMILGTTCGNLTMEGSSELSITGDLTIPSSRSFTCNGTNILNVEGDWTNNGIFTPGSGTVDFYGTNGSTISGGAKGGSKAITDYTLSTFTVGMTNITGGNTGPTGDDGSLNVNLGFTFNYDGVNYTQARINTNGWVSMNLTGTSQTYNNTYLFNTTAPNTTLSPWWDDLNASGGNVYYKTEGTSPNQVFIVEWNGVLTYYTGATARLNFQLRLYENTNVIEFHYGTVQSGTHSGSESASIGIEDATGGNGHFIEATTGSSTVGVTNLVSPGDWPTVNYRYSSATPSLTFNNITISKSNVAVQNTVDLNLNGDYTVRPGAYFTNSANNTIAVTGNTYFEADNTGMASYIDNGTTTVGGNTFVEQYFTSQRWHLVSPPVSGGTINTYYDIYLKEYNEPTDTWTYLVTPTTMPMIQSQGYSAWASNAYTGTTTVTYTGTLNNTSFVVNNLDYTPAAAKAGFNLLGNPYPCALDWNNSWSMTDMSGWMVIYDNGTYRGMHTDGTPYNGKADGIIPSTQGFWVRAMNATASITIPASERVHSGQTFYKKSKEIIYPVVRLETEVNGYTDETVVIFHPEATSGYDGYYDLTKFENISEAPQLYTMTEGGNYGVNFYHETYDNEVIPVGFKTEDAGLYTITSETVSNFVGGMNIYLEDIKTGGFKQLYKGTQHSFSYDPLDEEHRFNLHFTTEHLGTGETAISGLDIYSFGQIVYVKNPELIQGDIAIYDVIGQIITTKKTGSTLTEIPITKGSGYYFVKVQTDTAIITEKVFIR